MTIDEANARATISDPEFAQLPGFVRDHIAAHIDSGGNWERDNFRNCFRNKLVPITMSTEWTTIGSVSAGFKVEGRFTLGKGTQEWFAIAPIFNEAGRIIGDGPQATGLLKSFALTADDAALPKRDQYIEIGDAIRQHDKAQAWVSDQVAKAVQLVKNRDINRALDRREWQRRF